MISRTLAAVLTLLTLPASAKEEPLVGVWESTRTFGPEIHGPLTVCRESENFRAEVNGHRSYARASEENPTIGFGEDIGEARLVRSGEDIVAGHWIQPRSTSNGTRYASPIDFRQTANGCWEGAFVPYADELTLYLVIEQNDGLTGFLRNPDRNVGAFLRVGRIERDDESVRVFGRFRGRGEEQLYFEGRYDSGSDRLSLFAPFVGSTFDFHRAPDNSGFYARNRHPPHYHYVAPMQTGDGWQTGDVKSAGIALAPLVEMIEQEVDPVPRDIHAHDLHAVLIARNGVLVFEEYFHGYDRDTPHDTRSASKSLTATLYGAAIEAGLIPSTPMGVYETLGRHADDPRAAAMTTDNLLTQTSGFYCDDNDSSAPGNEDTMQGQTDQPDWYAYTLSVPMAYAPGEKAIYCSANPNLLGDVLATRSGIALERLFQDLIASPLQLGRYHMNLQPTGEPYMGGGVRWLPRDFLKLGQLYLNDGVWAGHRVISKAWATDATRAKVEIGDRGYGYQWWVQEFTVDGHSFATFYAGGNGGQIVLVVRELGLVVGFFGGNYSDPVLYKSQNELFPNYILRAVLGKS